MLCKCWFFITIARNIPQVTQFAKTQFDHITYCLHEYPQIDGKKVLQHRTHQKSSIETNKHTNEPQIFHGVENCQGYFHACLNFGALIMQSIVSRKRIIITYEG